MSGLVLDFSQCKTAEDVQEVFKGKKKELDVIKKVIK